MASQWISSGNSPLGFPAPGNVYDNNMGIAIGTTAKFRDIGTTFLGEGDFIWLPGGTSVILGSWCQYTTSDGTANTGSVALWAGTANSGFPLAIATAATIASTWGWYQRSGSAICAINGTIAAGNGASWQAAGVVQATPVADKSVTSVRAQTAHSVPAAGQAIYLLGYPAALGEDA